jgi:acyl phosphate:glycerol-3-phosphate acyltransferase
MQILLLIAIFIISYLTGAIPWGFVIGKLKGVDIREHGSGNIGATNVTRTIGKRWGVLCFFIDFLKGFLPVIVVKILFPNILFLTSTQISIAIILAVLGTVIGHMYPIYLKFKGGKGVSTGAGALVAITPYAVICGLVVWVTVFKISKYVSLASIISAVSVAILSFIFSCTNIYPLNTALLYFIVFVAVMAVIKHKSNIKRLLNGTENSFKKK